jgi:hypothetical protein
MLHVQAGVGGSLKHATFVDALLAVVGAAADEPARLIVTPVREPMLSVAVIVEYGLRTLRPGRPLTVQEHRPVAARTATGHPVESQRLGEVEGDQAGERLRDRGQEDAAVEGDEVQRR